MLNPPYTNAKLKQMEKVFSKAVLYSQIDVARWITYAPGVSLVLSSGIYFLTQM